jgi:hypothetical protein
MFPSPTTYLLASNGVFVWARREGMEALVPVTSKITHAIRGLYPATPYVRLAYPLVDQHIMQDLFMQACAACLDSKGAQEKLFYLNWKPEAGWQLTVPPQQTESARVTPLIGEAHRLLYANTLLEIHSHQHFAPWFSATDNADEQGCRIYGVVGHLLGALPPEIRLRIGIYGHFWDIPAHWIVQLPEGMKDSTWEAWSRSLPDWGGVAV